MRLRPIRGRIFAAGGGGSQSPNAGVDDWYWNNGYNQDWQFVPSPWTGWYEIINRGSGQ